MEPIILVRMLHIIGACVLLGTGAGIAFFMVMAHRTRDPRSIAHVAGTVVIADLLFTATAVIAQPLTGITLAHLHGWRLSEGWIVLSLALYIATGAFWLPVVWIQLRLRDMARQAADAAAPLPSAYASLFKVWFWCGVPAFACVLAIVWLMVRRPTIMLL